MVNGKFFLSDSLGMGYHFLILFGDRIIEILAKRLNLTNAIFVMNGIYPTALSKDDYELGNGVTLKF